MTLDRRPMRHATRKLCAILLALSACTAHAAVRIESGPGNVPGLPAIGQTPVAPGDDPDFEATLPALPPASASMGPSRAYPDIDFNLMVGGGMDLSPDERPISVTNLLKSFRIAVDFEKSETEFRRKFWALFPLVASITLPLLLWWMILKIWGRVSRYPLGWSA